MTKIEPPEMYSGAKMKEKIMSGGKWKLPSKAMTPTTSAFVPASDGPLELDQDDQRFFQELIGILKWAIEIERVDDLRCTDFETVK
jgi:hypothetical protein